MSRRLRTKKHPLRFVVWFLLLLLVGFTLQKLVLVHIFPPPKPLKKIVLSPTLLPSPTPPISGYISPLKAVVDTPLKNSEGTYSVAVKDLQDGESYFVNEHHTFETASIYKLWVLTIVYQKIQKGELQKDQVLTEDVSDLNDEFNIANEEAEQLSGTVSYSVSDALEKMVIISDNYAALLLAHTITYDSIISFLKTYGLNESHVGIGDSSPTTTAFDLSLFLEKLYAGQFVNKTYTQEIASLLERTQFNDVIPKYLPKNVKIAHKTGALDFISNDAGIVYTPKRNYLIVVLSDSGVPLDAEDRMAHLSKSVFDYFANKPVITPPPPVRISPIYPVIGIVGVGFLIALLFLIFKKEPIPEKPNVIKQQIDEIEGRNES